MQHYLRLRYADKVDTFKIRDISNGNITEMEFDRWRSNCVRNQVKLPNKSKIAKKRASTKELRGLAWTSVCAVRDGADI